MLNTAKHRPEKQEEKKTSEKKKKRMKEWKDEWEWGRERIRTEENEVKKSELWIKYDSKNEQSDGKYKGVRRVIKKKGNEGGLLKKLVKLLWKIWKYGVDRNVKDYK